MANFSVEWLSRSFYAEADPLEFTQESESHFHSSSPNNSCGDTSGSDSEEEAAQQRRMRTKFTSQQITKLEETFRAHKYLGATQRRTFAEKLNLSETQVKTWFQNRRMKLKREFQDARPTFLPVSAALLPPLLFQHQALRGQLPAAAALYPPLQPLHRALIPAPPLHPAVAPHPRYY